MNVYLASEYDARRGFGAYCAFYEQDGQHTLRSWRTQQWATDDSLALENAIDSLEQITHIIPTVVLTQNHYLLKGCTEHISQRRLDMQMQKPAPHVKLWLLIDRFIDEWLSYGVALEWRLGSHPYTQKEMARLMVR